MWFGSQVVRILKQQYHEKGFCTGLSHSILMLTEIHALLENGTFVSLLMHISPLNIQGTLNIYFHQANVKDCHVAIELQDAVISLRQEGAFVAIPPDCINMCPVSPHPVGE